LNFALKKDSFAVQFEGYLHITKRIYMISGKFSDDGSKVYFNDELFLDNDVYIRQIILLLKLFLLTLAIIL